MRQKKFKGVEMCSFKNANKLRILRTTYYASFASRAPRTFWKKENPPTPDNMPRSCRHFWTISCKTVSLTTATSGMSPMCENKCSKTVTSTNLSRLTDTLISPEMNWCARVSTTGPLEVEEGRWKPPNYSEKSQYSNTTTTSQTSHYIPDGW